MLLHSRECQPRHSLPTAKSRSKVSLQRIVINASVIFQRGIAIDWHNTKRESVRSWKSWKDNNETTLDCYCFDISALSPWNACVGKINNEWFAGSLATISFYGFPFFMAVTFLLLFWIKGLVRLFSLILLFSSLLFMLLLVLL